MRTTGNENRELITKPCERYETIEMVQAQELELETAVEGVLG